MGGKRGTVCLFPTSCSHTLADNVSNNVITHCVANYEFAHVVANDDFSNRISNKIAYEFTNPVSFY